MSPSNFDIDLEFGEVWEERVRKIFENKGTIEVKTERDIWRTTGNIVIEIGYKGRPSGLSITDAEWWIHVLTSSGEFHTALIFKVKKLRQTVTELVTTGKADCEEIDVLPGGGTGGENFGWRLREGVIQTPEIGIGGPKPPGALGPIFDYPHPTAPSTSSCSNPGVGFEGFSVTGGYVYRGPVIDLRGRYFFADYLAAELWSFRFDGSNPLDFDGTNYTDLTNHTGDPRFTPSVGSIANVSSFGEDSAGRLYVLDLFGGEVFEVPEVETTYQQIVLLLAAVGLARRRLPRARAPRR